MIRPLHMLLFAALATRGFCYDDTTIGQLPPAVAAELMELLTAMFPSLKPNCTIVTNPKVNFLLYTRDNPNNPITLDPKSPTQVDPRRKILLVIHGWLSNPTTSHIQKLKDAYLKQSNCHIIVVDWSASAKKPYTGAFCEVPFIGTIVSDFLSVLKENKVRLYMLNVIGHSMGAHIAGYMGKHLHGNYKEHVAKITGLDPAGPVYKDLPKSERLDKEDAELVDVIHTDGVKMGYYMPLEGVDFYPNCARSQPGCPSTSGINNDTLITDALCSSLRSLEYMAESVGSQDFVGTSCGMCPLNCQPDMLTGVTAIMGENYKPVEAPAHKHLYFMLRTNSTSPYALGLNGSQLKVDSIILCKNVRESPYKLLKKICGVY